MPRKLTASQVRAIRAALRVQVMRRGAGVTFPSSLRSLARKYGVTPRVILQIRKGVTYGDVA